MTEVQLENPEAISDRPSVALMMKSTASMTTIVEDEKIEPAVVIVEPVLEPAIIVPAPLVVDPQQEFVT
jgi:hypothetical protein